MHEKAVFVSSVLPYYDYYCKLHAAQKDSLELFSIELINKSSARTAIQSVHTKDILKKLPENLLRITLSYKFLKMYLRKFLNIFAYKDLFESSPWFPNTNKHQIISKITVLCCQVMLKIILIFPLLNSVRVWSPPVSVSSPLSSPSWLAA